MRFFRIFPYDPNAAQDKPGGALFVPPSSGDGRISNPDLYDVLYVSNSPEGAVAEVLGGLPTWRSKSLAIGSRALALAEYDASDTSKVVDLDDPRELVALNLRPSGVVSRDRQRTQAWARAIFTERSDAIGISWWSYYEPSFHIFGLWQSKALRVIGQPTPLWIAHPAVVAAAATIVRTIEP